MIKFMESRYHALAFLVVLAIVCLGAYLAVNAILAGGRTPLISLATPTPTRLVPRGDQTMVAPGSSIPTDTPVVPPTPAVPTATPVPPTPTPAPPTLTPVVVAATSTPTAAPGGPTSTPPGGYLYTPAGPMRSECGRPSALIYGWVRDAHDAKLAGVRVRVADQWGNVAEAISKGGNETGYYDVVRGMEMVIWEVMVVDEAGNPLSPVVTIEPVQGAAGCWYQLDWQRTD